MDQIIAAGYKAVNLDEMAIQVRTRFQLRRYQELTATARNGEETACQSTYTG
jgi:hypothetical protein